MMRNGQLNGSGENRSNVASLEEARKAAAEKATRAARQSEARPARSWRDWLIGGVVIAMAVAYLSYLILSAAGSISGGR